MRPSPMLAAVALVLPMPLLAQSGEPAAEPEAPATATETKEESTKLICKQEKPLGTRVAARKTCLTERQWRERSAQAQEGLERMTRTGNGAS